MNRKKKINQILKKKQKKMNSKLQTSNKPKYISKADRAKMELEAASASVETEQTEHVASEAPSEQ